jgi:protein-disulfide isomerase
MGRFRSRFGWLAILFVGIALPVGAQVRRPARSQAAPDRAITPAEIAHGKTFGRPTAPVKIEDFTDFECPACRALYLQTLRPLIRQYVDTGKVYLVHHDFPLPMHPYSHKAAYYADAAAAIGRFGVVENALFTHQPQWEENGNIRPFLAAVLTPADLKRVDKLAGTQEIQQAVQSDFNLGVKLKVHATPTMYISWKDKRIPIVGVVSFSVLQGTINAMLRQ